MSCRPSKHRAKPKPVTSDGRHACGREDTTWMYLPLVKLGRRISSYRTCTYRPALWDGVSYRMSVWVPNKQCGNSVSLDPKPKVFGEIWIGLVSPPNLNYLEINLEKFPPGPSAAAWHVMCAMVGDPGWTARRPPRANACVPCP